MPIPPYVTDLRKHIGHATLLLPAAAAIVRDEAGRVLLIRRGDGRGWSLPGGIMEPGECVADCVVREVWEESGFHVVPRKVIGVYDANRSGRPLELYHAYKVIFLCDLTGGEARPSDETSDVGFFPFDDLPSLSANRTHQRHLVEVLAHVQDPDRPAAFD